MEGSIVQVTETLILGMELDVGTKGFLRDQFVVHGIGRLTQVFFSMVSDELSTFRRIVEDGRVAGYRRIVGDVRILRDGRLVEDHTNGG